MTPDASPPIRVLIVGGVRHAIPYVAELQSHPGFEVTGITELSDAPEWAIEDAERASQVCRVPFVADIEDHGSEEFNLALVCTEPTRHYLATLRMAELGIATLVDKPVATSEQQLSEVEGALVKSGVFCTGLTRVYLPSYQRARELIDDGHVGWPISAHAIFLADGSLFDRTVERPELILDPALSGGGEVMNFVGYVIDYLRYLTGCEPRSVFGLAGRPVLESYLDAGVEDHAHLSIRFNNGFIASIVVGRAPSIPFSRPIFSRMTLVGTHGHLRVADDDPYIHVSTSDDRSTVPMGGEPGRVARRNQYTDLARSLHGTVAARYTYRDAAQGVRTALAAYRSFETGRPEDVVSPSGSDAEA